MDRSKENKNINSEELKYLDNAKAESLAVNINTSRELLRELACHNCEDVKRAVVKNPNSPMETILKLGEYFPQELLENPVFNLIVLANFNSVGDISYKILYLLLQGKDTPNFLLEYAASCQNEEIAQIATLHINLSGEITEGWMEVAGEAIKNYCSYCYTYESYRYYCCNSREDFKFIPGNHCKISDYKFLSYFAEFIPSSILNDKRLRIEVAKNPNTPGKILEQLAKDEDELVIRNIARNPNTPIKILEQFASKNKYPWTGIVENPNIPLKILKRLKKTNKLADDRNAFLYSYIMKNPGTPIKILSEKLKSEKSFNMYFFFRKKLVSDSNTPIEILERLYTDEEIKVRKDVARNPSTPIAILKQFYLDGDLEVFPNLASNPNTPIEILKQFATNDNIFIRSGVAKNPNTPIEILKRLSLDNHPIVRESLAINPSTPIEILKRLSLDNSYRVGIGVVQNLKCTIEIKKTIFNNLAKSHDSDFIRLVFFLSDVAEPSVLLDNCRSAYWLERYAIAQNVNTPDWVLTLLSEDVNSVVRATAKHYIKLYSKTNRDIKESTAIDSFRSIDTDLKLNDRFPKKLLDNPVFNLLSLKNFYLIKGTPLKRLYNIPFNTLYNLIQQSNTPKIILDSASKNRNREIQAIAKLHVNLSGKMNRGWHEIAVKEIQNLNRYSKFLPEEPLKALSNFSELIPPTIFNNRRFAMYVARNSKTPINILEQLATKRDYKIDNNLARNPKTPAKILEQILYKTRICRTIAKHPNISVKIIEKLALWRDKTITKDLLKNPYLPIHIRNKIIREIEQKSKS